MSIKKQFSQLKKSDELKPDKSWENKTKYELLAEISSQNRLMQAQKLTTSEKADMLAMNFLNKVAPSFSKVVAGFLIIMMGSGVSMAAQASVPGQALWPVKRSIEKAELTLTFSPVKETEIYIKHANERLDEIDKILKDTEDNTKPEETSKKNKAIKQAVIHLEKDMKSADNTLKVVKEEKKPLEVVELAKKVNDATKGVTEELKEKKAKAHDNSIDEVFDKAEKANEVVKDAAVSLALEVHEEVVAAIDASKESTEDIGVAGTTTAIETSETEVSADQVEADAIKAVVTEMIVAKIMETEVEIEDTKVKVGNVKEVDTQVVEINVDTDEETVKNIEDVKKTSEEAKTVLDEAKVLLEEGSLTGALERVSKSKEINDQTEVVLEQIEEKAEKPVEQNTEEVPVETSLETPTSSLEVIGNTEELEIPGFDVEITTDEEIKKEEDTEIVDPKELIYDYQLY